MNMPRANYSSGAEWEQIVGYSRAVRVGNLIEVSGTTAVDEAGKVVSPGNAYEQAHHILTTIEAVLGNFGAGMQHVVRTRIYVTDIRQWEAVGRAHRAFFKDTKPAATMVQVSALIDPAMVVEMEVTAII
jgi:enamine deaminase RidA (YjgF/YER057c/UK114 family)